MTQSGRHPVPSARLPPAASPPPPADRAAPPTAPAGRPRRALPAAGSDRRPPPRGPTRRVVRGLARPVRGLIARVRGVLARVRRLLARLRRAPARTRAWIAWAGRVLAEAQRSAAPDDRVIVAVDITPCWDQPTGVGWYLVRLLEQLADAPDVRCRLYGPTTVVPRAAAPPPVVPLPAGAALDVAAWPAPPGARALSVRALRLIEPWLIALQRHDVVFAPNFVLPRILRRARGAVVATVHDLAFRRMPETVRAETLASLERGFHRTLLRARAVITVSRAVRDELLAAVPLDPAQVTAIPHGPGQLARTPAGARPAWAPARYVLHVGTIEPRKNIDLLVAAWEAWTAADPAAPALLLCGPRGWKSEALQRRLDRARAAGWLHQPGYVDAPALAALYRGALAVVCPSRYEGFGLPLVEAMAAGAPVVASDIPVFREVAGDAALYAPVDDPAAWRRTLAALLADPARRARLARRGRAHADTFDWAATAARTRAVWRRAAGR